MQIKKFLSAIIACCSVVWNSGESNEIDNKKIIIEFRKDGKCFIECDGDQHLFKDLDSFSKNINVLTNKYFTTSLITTTSSNSIVFNNFKSNKIYYDLLLIGSKNIIIDYCYNEVNIPEIKISENINYLNIYTSKNSRINPYCLYDQSVINRGFINDDPIDLAINYK